MWCGEVQRRVIGLMASGQQVIPALRSTDLPAKSWLGLRPLAPSIHGQEKGVVEWYCRVPCCDRMTILAHTLEKGCGPKSCALFLQERAQSLVLLTLLLVAVSSIERPGWSKLAIATRAGCGA